MRTGTGVGAEKRERERERDKTMNDCDYNQSNTVTAVWEETATTDIRTHLLPILT